MDLSPAERLTVEAERAGLRVERIYPMAHCSGCFQINILQPDGTTWAEASHETARDIERHIENWRRRSMPPQTGD